MTDELSTLSPAAADAAASGVRTAAVSLADVSEQVSAARVGLGGWRGVAEAGFAERVVELQDQLDLLTWTARAGAGAIAEYSRELGMLQSRLHSIDTSLADVARRLADPTLDLVAFTSLWAEQERWGQSRTAALAQFDEASGRLAARLRSLIADVPRRPRTLGEHVTDGLNTAYEPVRALGFLALGWERDRIEWEETWRRIPSETVEQTKDPVGTLVDALPLDDMADGRWGAVAGAAAAAAVGRGADKVVDDVVPNPPDHGDRDRPRGPDGRYLPQTFDEMLAGVDLVRNEDQRKAHVIARHVDVDDEFLKTRLLTGQIEDGMPGKAPELASRWTSLEAAETIITQELRMHQGAIREWLASGGEGTYTIRAAAPPSAGVIWRLVDGTPTMVPVAQARIVLTRGADGSVVITTAFLDPL